MFALSDLKAKAGRTFSSLENTFENMLDGSANTVDSAREVETYKALLVETQMQQLYVSREYQKLFAEKHQEIAKLQDALGALDATALEALSANNSNSNDDENSQDAEEQSRDKDQLEYISRGDFEVKMKDLVEEKSETAVQARMAEEQLSALLSRVRALEADNKEQQVHSKRLAALSKAVKGRLAMETGGYSSTLHGLVMEYANMSADYEGLRQKLFGMTQERDRLQREVFLKSKSLDMMTDVAKTEGTSQEAEQVTVLESKLGEAGESLVEEQKRCLDLAKEAALHRATLVTVQGELAELRRKNADSQSSPKGGGGADDHTQCKVELQAAVEAAVATATAAGAASSASARESVSNDTAVADASRAVELETALAAAQAESNTAQEEALAIAAEKYETALLAAKAQTQEEVDLVRQELETALSAAKNASQEQMQTNEQEGSAKLQAMLSDAQTEHAKTLAQAVEQVKTEAVTELEDAVRVASEESVASAKVIHDQEKQVLEIKVNELAGKASVLAGELAEAQSQTQSGQEMLVAARQEYEVKLTSASEDNERVKTELAEAKAGFTQAQEQWERQTQEVMEARAAAIEAVRQECTVEAEKQRGEMEDKHSLQVDGIKEDATRQVKEAQAHTKEFEERYLKECKLRRLVHNQLMDMRGNIRVFCRVRPVLEAESRRGIAEDIKVAVDFPDTSTSTSTSVQGEGQLIGISKDMDATRNQFEFDSVFESKSTQHEVFSQVKALVTSVMDGYNVCMFAYGQTGSGKTHTMEGPPEDRGVNFRTLERLFAMRQEREQDYDTQFQLSVLEIYNETVYDLMGGDKEREALSIKLNAQGQVHVKGLTQVDVHAMPDVESAMKQAHSKRSVGSHSMNEHSSRSHLVLTVHVTTTNKNSKAPQTKTLQSQLNLIDLAGSERISKTDASGEQLKEAQSINKSLSALGDVIAALGERGSKKNGGGGHIPFRNSKLTYLLQPALQGDGKVAMFVNISPVHFNAPESLCSLNFASRCRKVELGSAKKNSSSSSSSSTDANSSSSSSNNSSSAELTRARKQIADLQAQVALLQRRNPSSSSSTAAARASSTSPRKSARPKPSTAPPRPPPVPVFGDDEDAADADVAEE